MKILHKIFRQTSWQVLGKAVTSLSTFIILGLVARNYGEAGTGTFTLVLTYLAIFYLLSDFGFNAHILKKVTGDRLQVTVEWRKLLGTRILWSIVLLILAVGTLPFWPASQRGEPFASGEFSKAVIYGALAIVASGIFVSCNLIFQSKLRYDLSVLASSTGTLLSLGIFIYLSLQKYPIPFLMLAHLISWLIIALTALVLVKKFLSHILPIYDIRYTINLFKDSWPIAATLALNVVYFRADSFMIAYFKGVSDVGIYNLAYSIFQSALVLPTFIMNAYYPLMLKSFSEIKKIALGLFIFSLLGVMFTIPLAFYVVDLITGGAGFLHSGTTLQILSLGFPAFFLSSLLMWILVTWGRYKVILGIYSLGLLINVILNYIFIPQYSYIAAASITVACEYLILILQVIIVTRH